MSVGRVDTGSSLTCKSAPDDILYKNQCQRFSSNGELNWGHDFRIPYLRFAFGLRCSLYVDIVQREDGLDSSDGNLWLRE